MNIADHHYFEMTDNEVWFWVSQRGLSIEDYFHRHIARYLKTGYWATDCIFWAERLRKIKPIKMNYFKLIKWLIKL